MLHVLACILLVHAGSPPTPEAGKPIPPTPDDTRIRCLAFSPDGKTLAVGMYSDDHGRVRLLDAADRRERAAYRVDFGVTDLAYTPDGCHLHLCGLIVHPVWSDALPGAGPSCPAPPELRSAAWLDTVGKFKPCEFAYHQFFRSADGRSVARASGNSMYFDGDVTLGALAPSKAGRPVRLHIGKLTAVALASDPGRVAFAPDDETIRVRDLRTLNEVHRLSGHKHRVQALAISADGKRLVSGGKGYGEQDEVLVWDVDAERITRRLDAPGFGFNRLFLSADGRHVAVASQNSLTVFNLDSGVKVAALTDLPFGTPAAFSPDGRRLAVGTASGEVKIIDLPSR